MMLFCACTFQEKTGDINFLDGYTMLWLGLSFLSKSIKIGILVWK